MRAERKVKHATHGTSVLENLRVEKVLCTAVYLSSNDIRL